MNLLPQQNKRDIRSTFWLRVAVIALMLVTVTGIIGLALQAPSFFISQAKEDSVERQMDSLQVNMDEAGRDEISSVLRSARSKIDVLNTESATPLSEVAEVVIDQRPNGLTLSELSFLRQDGDQFGKLELSGIAPDREALRSYVSRLEGKDKIKNVNFPVRNLANDTDIEFSLTVTGSF